MRLVSGLVIARLLVDSNAAVADDYDDPETEAALHEFERMLAREPVAAPPAPPDAIPPPPRPPALGVRAVPRALGVALGRGRFVATLTIEASLTGGAELAPTSIAPDLSYGLTDRWTVSVVHSGFATTGFRGSAGGGLCVAGPDHSCQRVYDNGGVEALVDLARGKLAVAAVAGIHAVSFDQRFVDVKLGAHAIYRSGRITATFAPSALIGVSQRDAGNEGVALLPASIGTPLGTRLFVALGGGIAAPLANVGGGWTARLGIIGRVNVAAGTFVAMSLFLPQLAGGDDVAAPGADARTVNLWLTYAR